MYKCENCQQTFDSPNAVIDSSSEYWGANVMHYSSVCPYCGSDDYYEMEKCDICGEYTDGEICENCHELIKDCADEIRGKARYMTLRYNLKYNEFISHLIEELDK